MWQLQWMLSLLPDWIWSAMLVTGLVLLFAAFILKKIPFVSNYSILLKILGFVFSFVGVYWQGGIDVEEKWRQKVAEVEAKLKVAEEESKKENTKIVTKYITKREYYRVQGQDIVKYIDREITKYDNTCPIPKEVVKAHNDAAVPQLQGGQK